MKGSRIEEKEAQDERLHHQFNVLQRNWDSYKQSNPRTLRRYSTHSKAMAKAVQLLDSSPRHLMSSIQHRCSPSAGGPWKIRTNGLAAEEVRRERRAFIEKGRLKGRRLFEEVEGGDSEMDLGGRETTGNGWNGLSQGYEVRSTSDYDHKYGSGASNEMPFCFPSSSSSSPSSSVCGENVEREIMEEEKKVVASAETRRRSVGYGESGNGRSRWTVIIMGWLIASIIYAICVVPMRSFGGCQDEHERLLVPT
ncbi:hypothetical protein CJ030_MR4G008741 [Morella rubra]|uniref:Uncharacterized protein n=1 Tax=Morella rubra TaxID=262757 RepID=A0A6A1VXK8_9ROSI|nr:hypothetical protein CJ030_MR4G008741 [Morella rubra]